MNMGTTELIQRNEKFIEEMLHKDKHYFQCLKEGQAPEYFVLACSDSRVDPSIISQMPLGKMFVHRNIANQVAADDESLEASLYFALVHLKVKAIIIEGHTGCGGIQAAWSGNHEPHLKKWIEHIQKSLPNKETNPDHSLDELAKQNVIKQVENLKKHPVYKQYGRGVEVQGYLFDLATGKLERVV
jgi:carbonic anhydrase